MLLLDKLLPRREFSSYEDFKQNYKVNVPENFNFGFDVVDFWAQADPKKRALVWCDDHGGERTFTFYEISRLSNRVVNFLRSLGIRKGDRVMVILRRRWEYWVCATALHKLGAVIIPTSLQMTVKDIAFRAGAANIRAIITLDDEFVVSQVEGARPKAPSIEFAIMANGRREGWYSLLDELERFSDEFERPTGEDATHNDDLMLLYFTSGTTGMPKMVYHTFLYPLGHIVTAYYWQRVQEDKLHMSVSDSGWAKFGWGQIYEQWISGAVIFAYDMDKFIPKKLLEVIEKYKLTTFCAPVTMYRFMLQEDVKSYDLSSVQQFCTAGEPLNPEIYKKWYEATGKYMREGFGQTEGSVLFANFEWIDPKPGSTGKPSPLYDIKLINADGEECEDGEEGEIVICGLDKGLPLGLFSGYINENGLQRHGEAYHMSDMAWRDSDGYYWFVGRNDDVIKCSGYRIGPFEVESALLEHPAVVECAITAAPDAIRGQVVKATIVLAEGYTGTPELVKELQDHVKRVTAPYKYPRIVEFVDELPKTIGGKIKRAEIRSDTYSKHEKSV